MGKTVQVLSGTEGSGCPSEGLWEQVFAIAMDQNRHRFVLCEGVKANAHVNAQQLLFLGSRPELILCLPGERTAHLDKGRVFWRSNEKRW